MNITCDVMRGLVLEEVERQRPGLKAEFMDNGTSDGTLALYTVVERVDPADWRWCWMLFEANRDADFEAVKLEAWGGVREWLRNYDREVAEGPRPVEVPA